LSTAAQSEPLVAIPGGYYADLGHVYYNESKVVIPSVTQVLSAVGIVDYSHVQEDVLEHKRDLGDAAHFACHIIARGDTLDWDTVHEEAVPRVVAFERWMEDSGFVLDVVNGKPQTEVSGIGTAYKMQFGYTFDLRGKVAGKFPFIIDLKCCLDEEISWPVQLSAYAETQPKPDSGPWGRAVVQLKPDGSYKVYTYDNPRDRDVWAWALALETWKRNKGKGLSKAG